MNNSRSMSDSVRRARWRVLLTLLVGAVTVATFTVGVSDPAGAAPGDYTVTPASLDFGSVAVGGSTSLPITITNATTGTLTPDLSGSGTSSPFGMAGHCGDPIAPGESCTIEVSFQPTALGTATGSALIHIDGDSYTPLPLAGVGVPAPSYSLTPANLDFGDVVVGETATRTATLTNTGTTSASPLLAGTVDAPFSFGTGTCLTTLASGASCTGEILFSPTTEGPVTELAAMTVDGNFLGGIGLFGNGIAAAATVTVPSVTTDPPPPTTTTVAETATTVGETATTVGETVTATATAKPASTMAELPRTGNRGTALWVMAAFACFGLATVAFVLRRRHLAR